MAFTLRYPHARELSQVMPGGSTVGGTTSGQICSSDVGRLCVTDSTIGTLLRAELPVPSTFAGLYTVLGIVANVPTATTQGSTTPFWIEKIRPGDVLEADYSTDVETSTGGTTTVVVTSNIGYYFGIGAPGGNNTTTVVRGMYIDGSVATTACGTTCNTFFQMLGFSTAIRKMWGVVNSTNLRP